MIRGKGGEGRLDKKGLIGTWKSDHNKQATKDGRKNKKIMED